MPLDKSDSDIEQPSADELDGEECPGHLKEEERLNRSKHFTEMAVLFFGLFFHNIFVGITLGVSEDDYQLFIAILFHQFFEGLGMGSRVAMANLKRRITIFAIDLLFAVSAPAGIGLGLGIKSSIEDGSFTYSIVEGLFQALSGGILIYIAGTHMMSPVILTSWSNKLKYMHRCAAYVGILLGCAAMAVIGIWA